MKSGSSLLGSVALGRALTVVGRADPCCVLTSFGCGHVVAVVVVAVAVGKNFGALVAFAAAAGIAVVVVNRLLVKPYLV